MIIMITEEMDSDFQCNEDSPQDPFSDFMVILCTTNTTTTQLYVVGRFGKRTRQSKV